MLPRVLEPEVMDSEGEASDYDAMDHAAVNRLFVSDLLEFASPLLSPVLDVGSGTAQIPIELARRVDSVTVTAIDAAGAMIDLARRNVAAAGLDGRITTQLVNARRLPYPDGSFPAVISNSIVHHISEPLAVIAEIVRVTGRGGVIFVRDLARPTDADTLRHLVNTYAGEANAHQRKMFAESLHAALTVEEVREWVAGFGFAAETVTLTSDRHWTWAAVRP